MNPTDGEPVGGALSEPGVEVPDQVATETADTEDAQAAEVVLAQSALDVSFPEYTRAWVRRVRSGESGVLPVVGGLIVIIIIFQTQNSVFLSAGNLTNLLVQGSVFVMLGMAEVFVLLLGEIDLSVGFVAGVAGAITVGLQAPPRNMPWTVCLLAGLAGTAFIGFIQGTLVTRLRLPSFVVTLAGLLGWEGFLIWLINQEAPQGGGTIRLTNTTLINIVNGSLSDAAGWIVLAVVVIAYSTMVLLRDRRRRLSGLASPPLTLTLLKVGAMAGAGIALVAICNTNRGLPIAPLSGVPWVVPIVLGVLVAWTTLLNRTRYGRYVYAIGGNAEASRRAGINVNRIRLAAFTLTGLTAGLAGIIYASRLGSISNNIDGGTLVLYAVASAVIGGTSLFGGRGKMIHALLGGLVIATIYNGMGLLGLTAAVQYMVTALVLLAAVTVDALARRGSATA